MYQLTENIIAVDIPKTARNIGFKFFDTDVALKYNDGESDTTFYHGLGSGEFILIGITPLSEEQIKEITGSHTSFEKMYCNMIPYQIPVSPIDRWNDLQRHRGLAENKKYAIIKIGKE